MFRKKDTRFITRAAVIAAIYCALTLLLRPISYGEVQLRVSEALTILPVLTPAAVPGLFIGCLLANLLGGSTVIEDGCTLEKGVTVTNGVIIGKDTHVMKNIYSNEFKTRLFDSDLGVGGVYGSSFDIADAVYLGQALCSQSDGRAKIGVMSGSGSFSRSAASSI